MKNRTRYIHLDIVVSRKDHAPISNREFNKFIDDFIDFVESHAKICGGGFSLETARGTLTKNPVKKEVGFA